MFFSFIIKHTTHTHTHTQPYSFDIVNKVAKKFKDQEQRVVHTTPKSFLELLSLYQKLLDKKPKEMMTKINRLSDGLDKLRQTAQTVAEISEALEEQVGWFLFVCGCLLCCVLFALYHYICIYTVHCFISYIYIYMNFLFDTLFSLSLFFSFISSSFDLRSLSPSVLIQLVIANDKKVVAKEIAENVAVEKATVDEENAAAKIEEEQCNKIASEVCRSIHFFD